jgi:hypothetical protein
MLQTFAAEVKAARADHLPRAACHPNAACFAPPAPPWSAALYRPTVFASARCVIACVCEMRHRMAHTFRHHHIGPVSAQRGKQHREGAGFNSLGLLPDVARSEPCGQARASLLRACAKFRRDGFLDVSGLQSRVSLFGRARAPLLPTARGLSGAMALRAAGLAASLSCLRGRAAASRQLGSRQLGSRQLDWGRSDVPLFARQGTSAADGAPSERVLESRRRRGVSAAFAGARQALAPAAEQRAMPHD